MASTGMLRGVALFVFDESGARPQQYDTEERLARFSDSLGSSGHGEQSAVGRSLFRAAEPCACACVCSSGRGRETSNELVSGVRCMLAALTGSSPNFRY
jgi:hypothetical protein